MPENWQGWVELFSDSKEIANNLRTVECSSKDKYWTKEAADHIEGMFSLVKEMAAALQKHQDCSTNRG